MYKLLVERLEVGVGEGDPLGNNNIQQIEENVLVGIKIVG